jgi:hypothetical protein
VFKAEISLVDSSALSQPGFELAGGFDYVHAGNDSGGEKRKSNDGERLFTTEAQRHREEQ